MMLCFGGYITIMYFNEQLSTFVLKWSAHCLSSKRAILSGTDEVGAEDTVFIDSPTSSEMGKSGTSRSSYGTGYNRLDWASSEGACSIQFHITIYFIFHFTKLYEAALSIRSIAMCLFGNGNAMVMSALFTGIFIFSLFCP